MKKNIYFIVLLFLQLTAGKAISYGAASVTLTTSAIAAADVNQGSTSNIIYAVKMDVATESVTVNNIQFTLSGSHDANDLTTVYVYFNATSPIISGASNLGSTAATFAGPHAYSINISRTLTAGTSGYFIISVNVNATATDNKTVLLNGNTTPVTFGYTTSPNVTNNQNNGAAAKTIQAADVNLTTSPVVAANINQGSTSNIVYAVKMDVTTEPVTVNNIQFTLSGNHDANDLTTVYVYFNATSPIISGASNLGSTAATFDAPHAYSINISRTLAAGTSGYFIISVNVNATATDNKTVTLNGSVNPIVFAYTTAPNVVNGQNNGAAPLTIQAADVNLTTSPVIAANINQGSTSNIVYAVKMDVATEPVTVNNIQFTLSGNHDANDLTTVYVYFNATSPIISGASNLGSTAATFDAPHAYSINISRTLAAGTSGYFIISVNVSSTATDNKTIRITGATTPLVFAYTTAPNVVSNQNNSAATQTIQAADVNLTTSPVVAASINQGSTSNIVYAVKMDVATEPVTVNNIQFTLSGNHDANDLTTVYVYFNATSPIISGASNLGSTAATFAGPHAYSINISRTLAAATSGYFIISVNVSSTATDNKTIRITGATTPLVFAYTTAPNVVSNQNNSAASQTIQAADVNLTTSPVVAADINQGSTSNIVYAVKMDVATEPVTVNNIQFTLSGNHDANDLTTVYVYFNATSPIISGASNLGSTAATFDAPHAYSINISRTLAAATSGYFIISVNVSSTATDNKTVTLNGNTNPIVFAYTTAPNVVNGQNNGAAPLTIQAADVNLSTSPVVAANINQGSTSNIVYAVKMDVTTEPVTVNNIQFTLSGNHDANDLTTVYVYFNATSPIISGASNLGSTPATFAGPHAYSINISRTLAAATSGYFIISVNVSSTATDNKTVTLNGNTNPVVFAYTTAPNVVNSQNNGAAPLTIQAADVSLTTSAVAAGNIVQGSTSNIIYALKMDVTTEPVTVNNIQFTLSGNHDLNDLTTVYVYFNATSPIISGASNLGSTAATFDAPHAYSINISRTLAAATSGYFIISVNVNATASLGKTVTLNGSTNPVVFAYTTAPNITNGQTNGAGVKTISSSLFAVQNNDATGSSTEARAATPDNVIALNALYPNPAKDIFSYTLSSGANGKVAVKLTDLSGKTIISKKADVSKGANKLYFNVQGLANGVYYFVVSSEKNVVHLSKRIVVQH